MYNPRFIPQIEEFRRDLFGLRESVDRVSVEESARKRYSPPDGVEILDCYEDVNGEFVPNHSD